MKNSNPKCKLCGIELDMRKGIAQNHRRCDTCYFEENRPAPIPDSQWHTAPDGSNCCCTAEDRQYGCGCH